MAGDRCGEQRSVVVRTESGSRQKPTSGRSWRSPRCRHCNRVGKYALCHLTTSLHFISSGPYLDHSFALVNDNRQDISPDWNLVRSGNLKLRRCRTTPESRPFPMGASSSSLRPFYNIKAFIVDGGSSKRRRARAVMRQAAGQTAIANL